MLVRTGEEIIDLLRGGQGVFNVVPLAGVVGEVDAAIFASTAPAASPSPHLPGRQAVPESATPRRPSRLTEGG